MCQITAGQCENSNTSESREEYLSTSSFLPPDSFFLIILLRSCAKFDVPYCFCFAMVHGEILKRDLQEVYGKPCENGKGNIHALELLGPDNLVVHGDVICGALGKALRDLIL